MPSGNPSYVFTAEGIAAQIKVFEKELEDTCKEGKLLEMIPKIERRVGKWVGTIRSDHASLKPALNTNDMLWRVMRHYKVQKKAGDNANLKEELEGLVRGEVKGKGAVGAGSSKEKVAQDKEEAPPQVKQAAPPSIITKAPPLKVTNTAPPADGSGKRQEMEKPPKPAVAAEGGQPSKAALKKTAQESRVTPSAPQTRTLIKAAAPSPAALPTKADAPSATKRAQGAAETPTPQVRVIEKAAKGKDKAKVSEVAAQEELPPFINAKSKAKVKVKGQVAAVLQNPEANVGAASNSGKSRVRETSPDEVIVVRTRPPAGPSKKPASKPTSAMSISSAGENVDANTDAPGEEDSEWMPSKGRKVESDDRRKGKGKAVAPPESEEEDMDEDKESDEEEPPKKKARLDTKAAPAKAKGKSSAPSKAKAAPQVIGKKRGRPSKLELFPPIALASDTVNGRVEELVAIGRPAMCNQCIAKDIPCEVSLPSFNHFSVASDGLIGFACAECHRLKKRCLWNGLPQICTPAAKFSIAAEKANVVDVVNRLEASLLEFKSKNSALEETVVSLEQKMSAQEKVFGKKLVDLEARLEAEIWKVESNWERAHSSWTERVTAAESAVRTLSKDVEAVAPTDIARVETKADSALKRLDDAVRISQSVLQQVDDIKAKHLELDALVRMRQKEDSPSEVGEAEEMEVEVEPDTPLGPPSEDSDMDTGSDDDNAADDTAGGQPQATPPPVSPLRSGPPSPLPPSAQPSPPLSPQPSPPRSAQPSPPRSPPPSPPHSAPPSPRRSAPPSPPPSTQNLPAPLSLIADDREALEERVDYGEPEEQE
ncbi:hypothetical protein CPC08DRAFT_723872 [Agrocybe pediades]|nr:hypothetical protein CPC08DRAFT_723872 [Agrocybe pediades]